MLLTFPSRFIPFTTFNISVIFTLHCLFGEQVGIMTLVFIFWGPKTRTVRWCPYAQRRILSRAVVVSVTIFFTFYNEFCMSCTYVINCVICIIPFLFELLAYFFDFFFFFFFSFFVFCFFFFIFSFFLQM